MIVESLYAFIAKRPRLDYRDYSNAAGYRAGARVIARDLRDAQRLLRAIERRPSITEADIREAARHAFSGRLKITDDGSIDYCVGQYWPTEYRAAVCAVCASALWNRMREDYPDLDGHALRARFRKEYGAAFARRHWR